MPQQDVGYLIKRIHEKLKARADADLREFQLTFAQSRVLAFLDHSGGESTQKEIEVFLAVAHPTVVGIVARMEQNGFVACRPSSDNRNKLVRLTPKAEALGLRLEQHMRETEQALLAPLSPQEAEQLKRMLGTICEHMD